jgi:nucleotide-binding universal stress UspA family protein
MHVLIATDGTTAGHDLVQRAVGLLASPDRVTVLTVLTTVPEEAFAADVDEYDELDEPTYSPEQRERQWDAMIGQATANVTPILEMFGPSTRTESRIEAGDIAKTIGQVARDVAADLIVVGYAKRTRPRQLTHRNLTDRVLRNAPCPVLVDPEI